MQRRSFSLVGSVIGCCVLMLPISAVASATALPKNARKFTISLAAPSPGDYAYADLLVTQDTRVTGSQFVTIRAPKGHPFPRSFAVYGVAALGKGTYRTTRTHPSITTSKNQWFVQIAVANPVAPGAPNAAPRPQKISLEIAHTGQKKRKAHFLKFAKLREANNILRTHAKLECYFPRSWAANTRQPDTSNMPSWRRYHDDGLLISFFPRQALPNTACPNRLGDNSYLPWLREATTGKHADGSPAWCIRIVDATGLWNAWTETLDCLAPLDHVSIGGATEATLSFNGQDYPCDQVSGGASCHVPVPAGVEFSVQGGTSSSPPPSGPVSVFLTDGHRDENSNPFQGGAPTPGDIGGS